MDANLYEIDSPYTNLTSKMDAKYICKQNRRARRDRCVAGLIALAVLICVTSCVVSCVCALYCVRASGAVQAAEERLLKQQLKTGAARVPNPHAEAMIDFKQFQDFGLVDDYVDDDDTSETSESSEVGDEDGYLDSEDDTEYLNNLDDDDDDDDDDDNDDDDDDNDGFEEKEEDEYEDLDSDEMDLTDQESGTIPDDQDSMSESGDSSILDVTGYISDDEDFSVEGSGLQSTKLRTRREAATDNTKKNKKNKKGKKGKKSSRNERGENTTEKRGKKVKKARLRFLPAAQFDGSIDNETIKRLCPEYRKNGGKACTHVPDMEGTLCTNKSFIPDEKNQALKILKPESWVTKNTSPVDFNGSTLTVKSNGVYLVYAQVLFSGYEAKKSASAIVKSGESMHALSCNADVSTNNLVLAEVPEINMRTCTIVGLLYLKKDDTLELQTGNRRAPIERKEGATYFGIVQLNKDK